MELACNLQVTHLKCAIQWFSVPSLRCTTITKIGFFLFLLFQLNLEKQIQVSVHLCPLSPTPSL